MAEEIFILVSCIHAPKQYALTKLLNYRVNYRKFTFFPTAWKVSAFWVFPVRFFPAFGLNTNRKSGEKFFHAGKLGNKAKGRISKQVFQENKARQIFRKTNISYPLILTLMYVCVSEGKKCSRALFSWKTRFDIRPFALLSMNSAITSSLKNCIASSINKLRNNSREDHREDIKRWKISF